MILVTLGNQFISDERHNSVLMAESLSAAPSDLGCLKNQILALEMHIS